MFLPLLTRSRLPRRISRRGREGWHFAVRRHRSCGRAFHLVRHQTPMRWRSPPRLCCFVAEVWGAAGRHSFAVLLHINDDDVRVKYLFSGCAVAWPNLPELGLASPRRGHFSPIHPASVFCLIVGSSRSRRGSRTTKGASCHSPRNAGPLILSLARPTTSRDDRRLQLAMAERPAEFE
jgi:hypothetical protein